MNLGREQEWSKRFRACDRGPGVCSDKSEDPAAVGNAERWSAPASEAETLSSFMADGLLTLHALNSVTSLPTHHLLRLRMAQHFL